MGRANIADPATFAGGVPHEEFARRRRAEPVGWVDEPALLRSTPKGRVMQRGTGYWAVTRYEDVVAASRQPELFSSSARGVFINDPRSPEDVERTRHLLISQDPPVHTVTRRLLKDAFSPKVVAALEQTIATYAEVAVRRVAQADQFDAVGDLATDLPLLVISEVLGVPHEDRGLLREWSGQLVGFDDPAHGAGDIEGFRKVFVDATKYVLTQAAAKRRNPGDDLVSLLVNAETDGERMPMSQVCNLWILFVVAGNETARNLISGMVDALIEFPLQAARLVENPSLVPDAVDEMLRWTTPIMQFRRTATADTVLGGQPIAAGDKVVLYYVSANRDERAFTAPATLDVGRRPNFHVAFGIGPHFCIGARLARMEGAAVLRALLPHLRSLERRGPPTRLASNFVNSFTSLPVSLATS